MRLLLALIVLMSASPALAGDDALYRAETIVTGTEEPERTRGFAIALRQVVVKLTGNIGAASDPRLDAIAGNPHRFVARFSYEDRMKGIPVHDEQGTRERPHFLRVVFASDAIDAELARLGLAKWPAPRPAVALWLAVGAADGAYVLHKSGPQGFGQRAVAAETAARLAIPLILPEEGDAAVQPAHVANRDIGHLRKHAPGADAVLAGMLSLAANGYWDMEWTLWTANGSREWKLAAVSFDTALKNGLETAAIVLSGNADGQ